MNQQWLERRWYSSDPAPLMLRPFATLYGSIAAARRARLTAQAKKLSVPIIVVGNISIGGTGKTPFTIWLVERLREWGWRPGVISRGYGGRAPAYPLRVTPLTSANIAGDEPALIARRLRCPVAVAPDRVAAAGLLIKSGEVDILVSDDGLQHYNLARDLEICVVDGVRGLGNGALLPAGPLREPRERLAEVGLVVINGSGWDAAPPNSVQMTLASEHAYALFGTASRPLAAFAGRQVHAVAGIGNPQRFFAALREQGLLLIEHPFPDHHAYSAADLDFGDKLPVLMTEKDAVKCASFEQAHHWCVPVHARMGIEEAELVRKLIEDLKR